MTSKLHLFTLAVGLLSAAPVFAQSDISSQANSAALQIISVVGRLTGQVAADQEEIGKLQGQLAQPKTVTTAAGKFTCSLGLNVALLTDGKGVPSTQDATPGSKPVPCQKTN